MLQGSIMAAALGDPAAVRVDPVTLAALQDTGWYSVNHSRAQSLVWGEGETGDTVHSLKVPTDTLCHHKDGSEWIDFVYVFCACICSVL